MIYTYYAIYLCGDALPSALFLDKDVASKWPAKQPYWMSVALCKITISITGDLAKEYIKRDESKGLLGIPDA